MSTSIELDIPKDASERELIRLTRKNERLSEALREIMRRNNVYQGECYKIAREALDEG